MAEKLRFDFNGTDHRQMESSGCWRCLRAWSWGTKFMGEIAFSYLRFGDKQRRQELLSATRRTPGEFPKLRVKFSFSSLNRETRDIGMTTMLVELGLTAKASLSTTCDRVSSSSAQSFNVATSKFISILSWSQSGRLNPNDVMRTNYSHARFVCWQNIYEPRETQHARQH